MARVLLVEDDEDVSEPLARAIERDGHEVEVAGNGPRAVARAIEEPFDVIVLDVGLPGFDGLEVCRRVRSALPAQPILMLTARGEEVDTVVGLDAGADDYVAKPFRLAELLARIRALVRRAVTPTDVPVDARGRVDRQSHRAWLDDTELELSPKEFDLLALLVENAGRVLSREEIIDEVWDPAWFGPTKTLDMHVSQLRRKLDDDPADPRFITTVRGVGYRFEQT